MKKNAVMEPNKQRIEHMKSYVMGLYHHEDAMELYQRYKEDIQTIAPHELFSVFHQVLELGVKGEEILVFLDKITNVVYNQMIGYEWKRPKMDSFLGVLRQENDGLVAKLSELTKVMVGKRQNAKKELLAIVKELQQFDAHYLKKENILFPMMEKRDTRFDGVSIMWSLHDEIRAMIKDSIALLESDVAEDVINIEIGSLFFVVKSLVAKEEMILFPTATELFSDKEFDAMLDQCFEYDFCFMDTPIRKVRAHAKQTNQMPQNTSSDNQDNQDTNDAIFFQTETGSLSFEQIELVFGALPVDLSFVDENNQLRYFTRPKDRIFPRSPAAIGRNVRNCHPEKSVDVVMEIIEEFRQNRQDSASFWLEIKGKMILIQYFAMRNAHGEYKGVLEVSQDITMMRSLEGQRRLVQWGK